MGDPDGGFDLVHDRTPSKRIFEQADIARRTEAKSGFKVLGTMVTFDNAFDAEVESRFGEGYQGFVVEL